MRSSFGFDMPTCSGEACGSGEAVCASGRGSGTTVCACALRNGTMVCAEVTGATSTSTANNAAPRIMRVMRYLPRAVVDGIAARVASLAHLRRLVNAAGDALHLCCHPGRAPERRESRDPCIPAPRSFSNAGVLGSRIGSLGAARREPSGMTIERQSYLVFRVFRLAIFFRGAFFLAVFFLAAVFFFADVFFAVFFLLVFAVFFFAVVRLADFFLPAFAVFFLPAVFAVFVAGVPGVLRRGGRGPDDAVSPPVAAESQKRSSADFSSASLM